VDSHFEKDRAEEVASRVIGVVEIANLVDVLFTAPRKFDWQLRLDINQKLLWNPFVDSEAITVSVDDGVASLAGKVDNWLAHRLAIQNAYDARAARVRDHLQVTRGPQHDQP
jgi:osmotically-inducible protein OsmY